MTTEIGTAIGVHKREMVAISTYASVLNEGADDEITFFVPKEWAEQKIKALFDMSLDQFFSEYTWDLSESLYHEGRNDEVLLHAMPAMNTFFDGVAWVCTFRHGDKSLSLRVVSATEPTIFDTLDSLFAQGQPTVGTLDFTGWCEFYEKDPKDLELSIQQYRRAQKTQTDLEQLFGPDYNPVYNIVKARLHITVSSDSSDVETGDSADDDEKNGGEDEEEDV